MSYDIQKVKIAREMRLFGKSLSEISKETGIPRSTLSNWFRDITLTSEQRIDMDKRVLHKVSRGRLNSVIFLKSKRIYREKTIFEEAEREFETMVKDPFFVFGLSMYALSGAQKGSSFQFSSSKGEIINAMVKWVKKYLGVSEDLIKIRNYGSHKRLDISRIDVLRRVIAWQKLLIKYYDGVSDV